MKDVGRNLTLNHQVFTICFHFEFNTKTPPLVIEAEQSLKPMGQPPSVQNGNMSKTFLTGNIFFL